jgi:hypothetical protein
MPRPRRDGGVWLWHICADRFEKCPKASLDFCRLSQHLLALAAALHGAGTAKAAGWCGKILHDLKHKSPARLFKTLDELLLEPPSADDPAVLEEAIWRPSASRTVLDEGGLRRPTPHHRQVLERRTRLPPARIRLTQVNATGVRPYRTKVRFHPEQIKNTLLKSERVSIF